MFEAAIFDWDGTLADTRRAIVVSFRKALGEVGVVVPDEYVERRIGIGAALTFREILKSKGMVVDEEIVERLVRRKSEVQIKLAGEVRLFEGARELLESLQGKIKVGLASMNNRSVIEHILRINHLEGCFEVVVSADDVSRSKPNPEIFKISSRIKRYPIAMYSV